LSPTVIYTLSLHDALPIWQLLRSVVSESQWTELQDKGVFQMSGKRGNYVISPYSQTEIRDASSGRCVAYACLQLSIPAPTYDRRSEEHTSELQSLAYLVCR